MTWRDAVLRALHRYAARHGTRILTRQALKDEEIANIRRETRSVGITPGQTLSRILQELRTDKLLYFAGDGRYVLLDSPIRLEKEDLPDDAIDFAVTNTKLDIGDVPVDDVAGHARQRRGQDRIRLLTLQNYGHKCAFCDVAYHELLVAGHVSRWADDPQARGNLSNAICLCRLHDPLFEYGYMALRDDYSVLKKNVTSKTINAVLEVTDGFRAPKLHAPASEFLRRHRIRTGFESE